MALDIGNEGQRLAHLFGRHRWPMKIPGHSHTEGPRSAVTCAWSSMLRKQLRGPGRGPTSNDFAKNDGRLLVLGFRRQ